jgi:hypothetical protein
MYSRQKAWETAQYRTQLRFVWEQIRQSVFVWSDSWGKNLRRQMIGGRDRARTGDPLLAKQVLSQLSYTPTVIILSHYDGLRTPARTP